MSFSSLYKAVFLAVSATTLCPVAQAESAVRAPVSASYTQECASCHMAYPAGLLPAASWQRLMGGLNQHYGVDASLDAATTKSLSAWLIHNAGTGKRARIEPPNDRITQADWFLREHNNREIPSSVWKRPSVGSAANCNACHANAAQGDFNEDQVRIPK
jgi:cytochrome c553